MNNFSGSVSKMILIPSSGGVFEVMVGGELIFSKKELDRFPEEGEISRLVKEKNLLIRS